MMPRRGAENRAGYGTLGLTGYAVMALDSDFGDAVTREMRPGMMTIAVEADVKLRARSMRSSRGGGHTYKQVA